MRTSITRSRPVCSSARERGSVYILVLGASLLVAAIGVSSLMVVRVQRRATSITADQIQAREMARTGIDRVLWCVKDDPTGIVWRTKLKNDVYQDIPFAGGTFSVTGIDPVDGNLTDVITDPVDLTSTGVYGKATYILGVTLNGDGSFEPGTWKRVVN